MSLTLHEQLMTVHIPLHHVRQAYVKITWYVIYVIGSWLHNPDHMLWLKIVEDQFTVTQIIKICVNAGFTAVVQLEVGLLPDINTCCVSFSCQFITATSHYYSYQSLLTITTGVIQYPVSTVLCIITYTAYCNWCCTL